MFSENGPNFQKSELRRLFNQFSEFYKEAVVAVEASGVFWKFIAPEVLPCGGP